MLPPPGGSVNRNPPQRLSRSDPGPWPGLVGARGKEPQGRS